MSTENVLGNKSMEMLKTSRQILAKNPAAALPHQTNITLAQTD